MVRNHVNGWVFCTQNVGIPDKALDYAVMAVAACGLDFGAVDIIWNESRQEAYVLEVNTAPGIEGSTLNLYAEVLKNA
jgi:glutathione synthase/RimK-type ligase-like ATP-grasp enzyme